jgi:hypothetical protein
MPRQCTTKASLLVLVSFNTIAWRSAVAEASGAEIHGGAPDKRGPTRRRRVMATRGEHRARTDVFLWRTFPCPSMGRKFFLRVKKVGRVIRRPTQICPRLSANVGDALLGLCLGCGGWLRRSCFRTMTFSAASIP